jgi:hypothetical protein
VRKCDGDSVHHAKEIDVRGIDEIGSVRVAQRHREDAGVRHDDIESFEVRQARFECVSEVSALPYVRLPGDDAPAEFLDRTLGLPKVFGRGERVVVGVDLAADIDSDDVCPFAIRTA